MPPRLIPQELTTLRPVRVNALVPYAHRLARPMSGLVEHSNAAAPAIGSSFVRQVPDGIGWKNRQADLRRIYQLRERNQIDGMYTLAMLDAFEGDVRRAAQIRGLLG